MHAGRGGRRRARAAAAPTVSSESAPRSTNLASGATYVSTGRLVRPLGAREKGQSSPATAGVTLSSSVPSCSLMMERTSASTCVLSCGRWRNDAAQQGGQGAGCVGAGLAARTTDARVMRLRARMGAATGATRGACVTGRRQRYGGRALPAGSAPAAGAPPGPLGPALGAPDAIGAPLACGQASASGCCINTGPTARRQPRH